MSRRWTWVERLILKERYNTIPVEELAYNLDRSVQSVRKQVHYLRKNGWTFPEKNEENK